VNRTQRGSSFSQSSHETFTDGCDVNNKSVGNSDLKYGRGLEKAWERNVGKKKKIARDVVEMATEEEENATDVAAMGRS